MKQKVKRDCVEASVLLLSALKWVLLSVIVGIVVGFATTGFLMLIDFGDVNAKKWPYYFLLMPLAFYLSSLLIVKLAPDAEGHGTEKVIEAVHKRCGDIDVKVVPVKLIATFITLTFGGSAGKEGPCAQIGAGIASSVSKLFKMEGIDKKRFVICGISAGFAGVFGTPIAGAIFAAEVLYVGKFSYIVLLPSLISSYVSCMISRLMGMKYLTYSIPFSPQNEVLGVLSMLIFGVFIGIVAIIFIRVLHIIEESIGKINMYKPYKGILGGLFLILIVYVTKSKDYIGLGSYMIDGSISGQEVSFFAFLIKMITTSVTLGSGGSGGILTPVFYIGATAGNAWAQIINSNIAVYSSIGMVAFLAACANTPIAAIIIAMELFGLEIAPYAAVACAVSYLVVGHKGVYPSQVLAMSKTPSLDLEANCELKDINKVKIKNKYRAFEKVAKKLESKTESKKRA